MTHQRVNHIYNMITNEAVTSQKQKVDFHRSIWDHYNTSWLANRLARTHCDLQYHRATGDQQHLTDSIEPLDEARYVAQPPHCLYQLASRDHQLTYSIDIHTTLQINTKSHNWEHKQRNVYAYVIWGMWRYEIFKYIEIMVIYCVIYNHIRSQL